MRLQETGVVLLSGTPTKHPDESDEARVRTRRLCGRSFLSNLALVPAFRQRDPASLAD